MLNSLIRFGNRVKDTYLLLSGSIANRFYSLSELLHKIGYFFDLQLSFPENIHFPEKVRSEHSISNLYMLKEKSFELLNERATTETKTRKTSDDILTDSFRVYKSVNWFAVSKLPLVLGLFFLFSFVVLIGSNDYSLLSGLFLGGFFVSLMVSYILSKTSKEIISITIDKYSETAIIEREQQNAIVVIDDICSISQVVFRKGCNIISGDKLWQITLLKKNSLYLYPIEDLCVSTRTEAMILAGKLTHLITAK